MISVSGKGGTGKTTLTALLVKYFIQHTTEPMLVVDADPATNLPGVLGVEIRKTVGEVTDELKRRIAKATIPLMVSKEGLLESWIFETLVEGDRFDLLAMGRSEGEGCYCYVNNVLTKILDTLTRNYENTIMDMEAGLEHLSRRTERDVDIMFVTTDPSKMGLVTAKRIMDLTKEVHINVRKICIVGNMFPQGLEDAFRESTLNMRMEVAAIIPVDPDVSKYNMLGKSLLALPEESSSYKVIVDMARRLDLR